ncbi:hypothetical protein PV08_05869 [Exophiala spinifera]|uniref:Uracil catabolism protein 4 n=1 Tax=Exophiala spinifera TaxID=91928 RepID=A0A0D2BWY7_9EURO|nr:uncharacterized protein PV08_05869 [Exophiala spinifera]KIW15819.1 hypothetical protein PV08_05869 [Exophiala spinifera]
MANNTHSGIDYVLSLQAVRERANLVYDLALDDRLNHFHFDKERLTEASAFVAQVISRDYGPDRYHEIPPHGRWQHFNVGGRDRISALLEEMNLADKLEEARVLVDLFLVSVLLDAGAGDRWRFEEPGTGETYSRSEGIAVASLHMFRSGVFSSTRALNVDAHKIPGRGLLGLTARDIESHFQIGDSNPMIGVNARVEVLKAVGASLLNLTDVFGVDGRPGRLADYLLDSKTDGSVPLDYLKMWAVLQRLLLPAWPKSRPQLDGQPIGDAWPLAVLGSTADGSKQTNVSMTIQPFHKLTQWLAYSLSVPFSKLLDRRWQNMEFGTGLPEYRNGGLFVDLQVLRLKESTLCQGKTASGQELPLFDATSDMIVEWRAMTVALLDRLHGLINEHFKAQGVSLTMAQVLEAGTWKSGRELAKLRRPETSSSPILIEGDGTLF